MIRRLLLAIGLAAGLLLTLARPAQAHPLGNFTVNHYHGLALSPTGITDDAVVDSAEIPTKQLEGAVDADDDGDITAAERADYAEATCAELAASLDVSVDGAAVPMAVTTSDFSYRPGQAGLPIGRLTCRVTGAADLTEDATLRFADSYGSNRVGWREITATAEGVHLDDSPVPAESITDALRHYPNDLLTSPLDVRDVTIAVRAGAGASTVADSISSRSQAGPFSRLMNRVNGSFNDIVGRDRLTVNTGLLAVGLALLLGASHAVLPGHGKTVMAAYIAGRQGSVRDAVVVGATVTATHTTGVIVLGLALTASSSLAGESVLRWLGVASGLLVASLGLGLLSNAIRHRTSGHGRFGHHHHEPDGHHHEHEHGHTHEHDPEHDHAGPERVLTRRGLVAMGIAGGLVPSPSALVVLLAALALGRTVFGVALVLFYGVGMAATLTVTGLVLVKLRDRYSGRAAERWSRRFALQWSRFIPYTTASIVIVLGVLLATRSLVGQV